MRATVVPTDVPIDMEMKHAAMKSPGMRNDGGNTDSVRLTVASIAPRPLASDEKAPANMKIQIM